VDENSGVDGITTSWTGRKAPYLCFAYFDPGDYACQEHEGHPLPDHNDNLSVLREPVSDVIQAIGTNRRGAAPSALRVPRLNSGQRVRYVLSIK
jgi:hypothetical protein